MPGALDALRERCAEQRLSNVSVVVGDREDPKLPVGSVDVVLMVNVLSALGDTNVQSFLGNLAKGLKPDGRLVTIDWDPVKLHQVTAREFGPEIRRTLRRLRDARFDVVGRLDFLPRQSMLICRQRPRD
jgi:SAM-dependent methyltransferase